MTIFNAAKFSIPIEIALVHFSHEKLSFQKRIGDINNVSFIKKPGNAADGIFIPIFKVIECKFSFFAEHMKISTKIQQDNMKRVVGFFLFFPVLYTQGQSAPDISSNPSIALDSAANLYFTGRNNELEIYNGRVFYGYPGIGENAFYPSKEWQKGSVLYDGTLYQDIFILYDIYKDQVMIRHPNTTPIYLFSERVQKFYFDGQTFVRLRPDKDKVLQAGFYQVLTEGKVGIIVMRKKKIDEKIVDLTLERKFISSNLYYALKDGNYYLINNKRTLLNLLKDKRQNILKHLKKEKLKYKWDVERTIEAMAEYYNQS